MNGAQWAWVDPVGRRWHGLITPDNRVFTQSPTRLLGTLETTNAAGNTFRAVPAEPLGMICPQPLRVFRSRAAAARELCMHWRRQSE